MNFATTTSTRRFAGALSFAAGLGVLAMAFPTAASARHSQSTTNTVAPTTEESDAFGSVSGLAASESPAQSPLSTVTGPTPPAPSGGAARCASGFVWREAFDGDAVCVTPSRRGAVLQENSLAASRRVAPKPYGPDTCISGYVWREAFPGDTVCVTPNRKRGVREHTLRDYLRKAGTGAYGPDTCYSGYVWRLAGPTDLVCVTPLERSIVKAENDTSASRRLPDLASGPNTCASGYVWRVARPTDLVCVTPASRDLVASENVAFLNGANLER